MKKRILYYLSAATATIVMSLHLSSCSHAQSNLKDTPSAEYETYQGKAMDGFPATPESQVTLMNAMEIPYNNWTFRNASIFPTLMIPRGGDIYKFPEMKSTTIEEYKVPRTNGQTVVETFMNDGMDGVIVIKDGVVRYERYFGDFKPHDRHIWASSTKSLTAMVAGQLIEEGKLDLNKTIEQYLPEMKGGAFEGLTVQQVLNMVSALDYSEDYVDLSPGTVHYEYFRRIGLTPAFDLMALDPRTDDTPRGNWEFIPQMQRHADKTPGEVYEYHSPNVDVIGLIMSRITNTPLNELFSEYVWQKLGTEHDAQIMVDAAFNPIATGGMLSTLRDFAKFGYTILNDGAFNGQQIFPKSFINDTYNLEKENYNAGQKSIYRNDSEAITYDEHFRAYKNFWWVHDGDKQIMTARGIYGQTIYIDKSNDVIIASFSSADSASNASRANYKTVMDAFKLIAETL